MEDERSRPVSDAPDDGDGPDGGQLDLNLVQTH
jgi:hypothetical protein